MGGGVGGIGTGVGGIGVGDGIGLGEGLYEVNNIDLWYIPLFYYNYFGQ